MSEHATRIDMPVAIPIAAKQLHIDRNRARDIAIRHGIAIRWGGSDARPRLKVLVSDLYQAVLSERYEPPVPVVKPKRRKPVAPGYQVHRLVTCWQPPTRSPQHA